MKSPDVGPSGLPQVALEAEESTQCADEQRDYDRGGAAGREAHHVWSTNPDCFRATLSSVERDDQGRPKSPHAFLAGKTLA